MVAVASGCWLWLAAIVAGGCGRWLWPVAVAGCCGWWLVAVAGGCGWWLWVVARGCGWWLTLFVTQQLRRHLQRRRSFLLQYNVTSSTRKECVVLPTHLSRCSRRACLVLQNSKALVQQDKRSLVMQRQTRLLLAHKTTPAPPRKGDSNRDLFWGVVFDYFWSIFGVLLEK